MKISIVIPVYNEVYTITEIIRRIENEPLRLEKEIIVVDDGSSDGTVDVLKNQIQNSHPAIHVLFHSQNQGKGAALKTGIDRATGDIVIIQDADLEYDPRDYGVLLEPFFDGVADVVYGSRFLGQKRRVLFFWHMIGNSVVTLISNIFTNLNLTDMMTGYKAFKASVIKNIPIRSRGFEVEPELTCKVAKLGCHIYEVPVSYLGRDYAEGKKIRWWMAFSVMWTTLKYCLFEDSSEGAAGKRTLRIMEGAMRYNRWLADQIRPYLGSRILEIGCGTGNITKFLMDRELVVATDLNKDYLTEVHQTLGMTQRVKTASLNVETGAGLEEIPAPMDSIYSLNVLEHIEDDRKALRNIFNILKPGGNLILVLPAVQAFYGPMDENLGHYRRYGSRELRAKLEEAGFKVETVRPINFVGALGWGVNSRILRRQLVPTRQLRLFDMILTPLLTFEKYIPIPFGLSLFAVASRPAGSSSVEPRQESRGIEQNAAAALGA